LDSARRGLFPSSLACLLAVPKGLAGCARLPLVPQIVAIKELLWALRLLLPLLLRGARRSRQRRAWHPKTTADASIRVVRKVVAPIVGSPRPQPEEVEPRRRLCHVCVGAGAARDTRPARRGGECAPRPSAVGRVGRCLQHLPMCPRLRYGALGHIEQARSGFLHRRQRCDVVSRLPQAAFSKNFQAGLRTVGRNAVLYLWSVILSMDKMDSPLQKLERALYSDQAQVVPDAHLFAPPACPPLRTHLMILPFATALLPLPGAVLERGSARPGHVARARLCSRACGNGRSCAGRRGFAPPQQHRRSPHPYAAGTGA